MLIALASFVPLLLIVTVVGLLVSVVFRRWVLSIMSVAVIAAAALVLEPLYVGGSATVDGSPLRVMQANLLFGEADPGGLAAQVRDYSVDVLTVQELTDDLAVSLRANGLEQLLPYQC